MNKIKIGVLGYGHLGKEVCHQIRKTSDMELIGVFSRRTFAPGSSPDPLFSVDQLKNHQDRIDVLILCTGSATDIPENGPHFLKNFNVVDCYDNHSNIPMYVERMNEIGRSHQKSAIVATGWDPGLFSLQRVLFESVLPTGNTFTFWGIGVSQGHSDAIRRIDGVKKAVQYTIPNEDLIHQIKDQEISSISSKEAHRRKCFVVLEKQADAEKIRETILSMPDYFKDYQTDVVFIDEKTFDECHTEMPHGGRVIRVGETKGEHGVQMEFQLDIDSNPEFTASVSLAYARACYRLSQEKQYGAKTVLDIPFHMLSEKPREELLKLI